MRNIRQQIFIGTYHSEDLTARFGIQIYLAHWYQRMFSLLRESSKKASLSRRYF